MTTLKRLATLLAATAFATGGAFAQSATSPETDAPNAPNQQPAFEGQTRAPAPQTQTAVAQEVIAEGLPRAWAVEKLPDGRFLINAKAGSMHIVGADGRERWDVAGVPDVVSSGQAGLLDIALSPTFAEDSLIYFSYSEPRDDGNGTTVARARLVSEGSEAKLDGMEVIFRQTPSWNNTKHFGSRLVFGPEGHLFVTVGERSDPEPRVQAQDLASGLGKVFRINADGSVPEDNPFVSQEGALDAIWSYGHRNLQSAALDGEGRLWTVEHGPKGGDELNRPEAGKNYGWPEVTYGVEYSGATVGAGVTQKEGTEQPVYYWDPVIGPSGMSLYSEGPFTAWNGAFLVGGLVTQGLVVLKLEGDRVVSEERVPINARIRDVKSDAEGVYLLTEEGGSSRLIRLTPEG